jgi:hypothetical protein
MSLESLNFVEQYIRGVVKFQDILSFIDQWHQTDYSHPLHRFLGLTEAEHYVFVESDSHLEDLLKAKKKSYLRSQFKVVQTV